MVWLLEGEKWLERKMEVEVEVGVEVEVEREIV